MPGVEFPGEIRTRRLHDLIRPAQLTDFPFQLRDPLLIPGRGPGPVPGIDLCLIHPVTQSLGIYAETLADPGDRPTRVTCLRPQLEDHLHCPFPQLSGMRLPGYHEPQLSQRSQPPTNPGRSIVSLPVSSGYVQNRSARTTPDTRPKSQMLAALAGPSRASLESVWA